MVLSKASRVHRVHGKGFILAVKRQHIIKYNFETIVLRKKNHIVLLSNPSKIGDQIQKIMYHLEFILRRESQGSDPCRASTSILDIPIMFCPILWVFHNVTFH